MKPKLITFNMLLAYRNNLADPQIKAVTHCGVQVGPLIVHGENEDFTAPYYITHIASGRAMLGPKPIKSKAKAVKFAKALVETYQWLSEEDKDPTDVYALLTIYERQKYFLLYEHIVEGKSND